MKIVACGPFIGSFEQEVMYFQPYVRYISEVRSDDLIYVSGYSNRRFLYDWVSDNSFFPVYEPGTRTDYKQVGCTHDDVTSGVFGQYVKGFRQYVKNETGTDDITMYVPPYLKNLPPINTVQKIYEPYKSLHTTTLRDTVVFIPDESVPEAHSVLIYNMLCNRYNVVVVGDCKTTLYEYNTIMQRPDYTDQVYSLIIEHIQKAKLVITPCSYWTVLCNIHGTPVVSWGESVGVYKSDGVFGFDNLNMILDARPCINIDVLTRGVETMMAKL